MKILLTILAIAISTCIFSQKRDSALIKEVISNSKEISYMKKCFGKAHEEHSLGTILLISGTTANAIGIHAMWYNLKHGPQSNDIRTVRGLVVAATALQTAGIVIILNSHRWIGKAAIGVDGRGINVVYNF